MYVIGMVWYGICGNDKKELMKSLQEELSTTRAQLARVKKERQILKAEGILTHL
jgi:hypothetical protein